MGTRGAVDGGRGANGGPDKDVARWDMVGDGRSNEEDMEGTYS